MITWIFQLEQDLCPQCATFAPINTPITESMAYTIKTIDNKLLEYDIRVPKREELQQVIDMVNDDNWNMSVDILTDVYDRQIQGFRAAVDKEGNVLRNIFTVLQRNCGKVMFLVCLPFRPWGVPCDHRP